MKLKVNGVDVPLTDEIKIAVETDAAGEDLPSVIIVVTGGPLQVYRSRVSVSGPLHVHFFGVTC